MNLKRFSITILTLFGWLGSALLMIIFFGWCLVGFIRWIGTVELVSIFSNVSVINVVIIIFILLVAALLAKPLRRIREKFQSIRYKEYANNDNRHATQMTAYGVMYVLLIVSVTVALSLLNTYPEHYPPLFIALSVAITVTVSDAIARLLGISIATARHTPVALCFEKPNTPSFAQIARNIALSFIVTLAFFSLVFLSVSVR